MFSYDFLGVDQEMLESLPTSIRAARPTPNGRSLELAFTRVRTQESEDFVDIRNLCSKVNTTTLVRLSGR